MSAHFVAVLATGFVLFTLLVNGTTLQLLLRLLHLDRLSKVDRAVRDRAIMLSLDAIRQRISAVAESDRIAPAVTARICEAFAQRISDVRRTAAADVILSDADLLQIGLITLATREQELHLQRYKERVVSRKSVQVSDRARRLAARWCQDRRPQRLRSRRPARLQLHGDVSPRPGAPSPARVHALAGAGAGRPLRAAPDRAHGPAAAARLQSSGS